MSDETKITKFKHDNGGLACTTSPREALMMALNDVDDYDHVVIVMGRVTPEDGCVDTRVNLSSPNSYTTAGLLSHALQTHWD